MYLLHGAAQAFGARDGGGRAAVDLARSPDGRFLALLSTDSVAVWSVRPRCVLAEYQQAGHVVQATGPNASVQWTSPTTFAVIVRQMITPPTKKEHSHFAWGHQTSLGWFVPFTLFSLGPLPALNVVVGGERVALAGAGESEGALAISLSQQPAALPLDLAPHCIGSRGQQLVRVTRGGVLVRTSVRGQVDASHAITLSTLISDGIQSVVL